MLGYTRAGMLADIGPEDLVSGKSFTVPRKVHDTDITIIGNSASENCAKFLETLTIQDNVKYVLGGAFAYCQKLTHVTMDVNTKVELDTFAGCFALQQILITGDVTAEKLAAFKKQLPPELSECVRTDAVASAKVKPRML